MAWNNTVDERYGGGYLSLSSDSYDASNLLNSTYTLAAGQTGYGNLTDWYSSADIDTYSLGILGVGSYVLDVDDYTWDFASFDYGSVSRFELLNASGTVVATRYGTFSNIDFTVSSADTYYVRIHGPSFGEAQYSVTYLSSNTPAVFGEATYVGDLQPGSVLSGSVAYVDANGNSDNIVLTQWSVGGADSGFAETYTVTAEDVGESIQFRFWFTDDLGNIEYSGWYSLGTVEPAPQSNSEPTGSVVISGTPEEGQTLTVSNDLSDADGIGTISYQWNRNGEAIEGATGDSYTLAAEDVGTEITVTASYTDGGSTDESVASQGTDAVAARGEERADFTKSLLIVIDDFSERVFDYSNVTLFDYGTYQNITYIDNAFSPVTREYTGYDFTYDDLIVNEADTGGFHMVTHDEDTSYAVDYDFVGRTEAVGWDGETAYLDTFWQFDRLDQSTEELPNHGDWVIESIVQTLDDPSSTSILAIDVDTLNGVGSHFDSLFRQSAYTHSTLGDLTLTGLERVLLDYLDLYDTNFNDEATESFFPSGVSVSIAGAPATVREAAVFTFLEKLFIPIFQAAPNVNQGHYDWGSNYVDVINVGAWNTDSSGDLLLSSINTVETLDLVADGHIQKEGWGDNFGTSFATPKVAAEWTNLINFYIASLQDESSSSSGGDNDSDEGVVDIDYTEYVSFIVDFVSTPVEVRFNNPALDLLWNDTYDYVRVLNDTVEANGYEPLELGYVDLGIDGTSLASATLFDAESSIETNNSPTGTVSIAGTATQGETLTASNDLSDVDGLGSISYQWNRDDVAITGATNSTYTLTQDDVGTEITVTASYTDGFGTEESVTSVETSVVANVNDAPAGSVSITGTATQGETLTASNDLSDVDGLGSISYQWNRDDVAITGATNSTYTLTQDDVGAEITVTASYTDGFGTDESVSSGAALLVSARFIEANPTTTPVMSGTIHRLGAIKANYISAEYRLSDVSGEMSDDHQTEGPGWGYALKFESGLGSWEVSRFDDDSKTFQYILTSSEDGYFLAHEDDWIRYRPDGQKSEDARLKIFGWERYSGDLHTFIPANSVIGEGSVISGNFNSLRVNVGQANWNNATDESTELGATIIAEDHVLEGSVLSGALADPGVSIRLVSGPADIELVDNFELDIDGSFAITPNSDAFGSSSFDYEIVASNGASLSGIKTYYFGFSGVNDAPTGSVTISGTATQGQTLTASNDLADIDGLGTIAYQWNRDDVAITGATTSTYTLTQDDVGAEITVTASYTDDQDTDEAVTSSATSAVANVNDAPTGSVTISGTATQGQTLTASNDLADIDGLGTIAYQWNRDDVAITGATTSTYTLTQDDVGAEITVTASYTDDQDTDEAVTSSATSAVANVNDAPTGSVTISGTATQGQTLTASNDLADIDGLGTIAYQWNRDDVAITGATTSTYTLTQDDVGAEITVTASYTDGFGTEESVTSAATSAVASSVLKTVEGHIYHWSSHKLMSDVTVEMMSDLHMTGDSPFLLQNLRAGDEGETLFDVVFDAGTDLIETLDLTINLQDGATGSFAWSDSLSGNNWQTQVNATETAILISGFQASGTSSGILAVGTLTLSGLDLNSLSIDLVNGGTSLNSIDTIYADTSATIEHSSFTTDAEGAFTVQVNSELNYHLTGTRELTDTETGRVVSAADALAALKLAVGNNPSGFDEISPYQLLAADVNQDGRVSAADALAILKMAVGLEGAPEREWIFVNETADFENADGLRFNRARIDWDQLDEPLGSSELNLVGLLKGDVNGSWPGPQADGFSQLPDSYFNDLETSGIGPAEQWWVV